MGFNKMKRRIKTTLMAESGILIIEFIRSHVHDIYAMFYWTGCSRKAQSLFYNRNLRGYSLPNGD